MEIKHPPENGNCSCKDCYKPMSKLDELDKELLGNGFRCPFEDNCPEDIQAQEKARLVARKYYSLGKLEEREALKKVVERMTSMMIYTEGKEIEFVEKADLLNELN